MALVGERWGWGRVIAIQIGLIPGWGTASVDIEFPRSNISVKTFQAGIQQFQCGSGRFHCGVLEAESVMDILQFPIHTDFPALSSGNPTLAWGGSDVVGVTVGFVAESTFNGWYSGRWLWTLSFWE
jgi:hypothetical protein